VEVLSAEGRVIEPFSLKNGEPVKAGHTKQAVRWKSTKTLQAVAGKTVKLRFHVSGGELYAFWMSPEANGASSGYVAAGGPGFTGSKDSTGL
jgi:hypothetical protein